MKKGQIQHMTEDTQGTQGMWRRAGEQQAKFVQETNNISDVLRRSKNQNMREWIQEKKLGMHFHSQQRSNDFCNQESLEELCINKALYIEINTIEYT